MSSKTKAEQVDFGLGFEADVRQFLAEMKFKDIDGGAAFRIEGYQVDAVCRHEDTGIIVECVTALGRKKLDFRNEIINLRGKMGAIIRGLKAESRYQGCKDFKFVLATNVAAETGDLEFSKREERVHLWNKSFVEYYRVLYKRLGEVAKNGILAELEIRPRFAEVIRTPCLRTVLNGITVYSFYIEPKKLLRYAFVARREVSQEEYYQRMVQSDRLRKIAYYVTKENGIFPNNIIIAFSPEELPQYSSVKEGREGLADWPDWLDYGVLTFPQSYRACWVVDGQHRLFSFTQLEQTEMKLPVVALANLPPEEQARFFLDINSQQKPVPPDLVWDLQGQLRPDKEEGIISRLAKELNDLPPLQGKIYIPSKGLKTSKQLKLSGICNTIKRRRLVKGVTENMKPTQLNPIYDSDHSRMVSRGSKALSSYLSYLSKQIKEPFRGEFLLQNSGLSIFLSLFERIIAYDSTIPTESRLQVLLSPFLTHLNSEYPTIAEIHALKLRCNSEGGRDEVTDDFVIEINELTNESLPISGRIAIDLGKRLSILERNLREVIKSVLSKDDPDWIKSRTLGTTYLDLKEKHRETKDLTEFLTLGQCVDTIIKRDDNWTLFKGLFLDARVGFDNKESLAVALNQIVSTRNSILHGRPLKWKLGDRAILDANMSKLKKIVENTIAAVKIGEPTQN